MAISKVWIEGECTSCGTCEAICEDVFEMQDIATVKDDIDPGLYEELIIEAAVDCLSEVIKYE